MLTTKEVKNVFYKSIECETARAKVETYIVVDPPGVNPQGDK